MEAKSGPGVDVGRRLGASRRAGGGGQGPSRQARAGFACEPLRPAVGLCHNGKRKASGRRAPMWSSDHCTLVFPSGPAREPNRVAGTGIRLSLSRVPPSGFQSALSLFQAVRPTGPVLSIFSLNLVCEDWPSWELRAHRTGLRTFSLVWCWPKAVSLGVGRSP